MNKFCAYCGSPVNETAKFCPQCGKSINSQQAPVYHANPPIYTPYPANTSRPQPNPPAQKKPVKQKKKKTTNKTKTSKRVIAILLAVAIALSGGILALLYSGKAPKTSNTDNFNSIGGKFTEILVTDEDSAIAAAKEAAAQMGLGNAADELTVKNVSTVGDLTYYRLQQNYQGVTVFGKDIIIVADEVGNAWSASSNMIEVPTSLDTDAELTEDEIISKAAEFLNVSVNSLEISSAEKIIRFEKKAQLVYHTYLSSESTEYNLYIPIEGKDVAYGNSQLDPAEVCTSENGLTFNGMKTTVNDVFNNPMEMYLLFDNDERFYCFDADKNSTVSYETQAYIKNSARVISNFTNRFGGTDNIAFTAAENLKKIKNYYVKEYTEYGYGGLAIVINNGGGTCGGKMDTSKFDDFKYSNYKNEAIGAVFIGADDESKDNASDISLMAHEYTHTITRNEVNWDYKLGEAAEQSCINEAYSDLFGMIIEAYINEKPEELSWNFRTDIKELAEKQDFPIKVNSYGTHPEPKQIGGSTDGVTIQYEMVEIPDNEQAFSYAYAVTLNYAAYLMTTGGDASSNLKIAELSDLWYNTLKTLHSDCNFSAFRQQMEITAKNLGFSEEKQQRISKSFDEIGIEAPKNKDEAIKLINKDEKEEDGSTEAHNFSETELIEAFEHMLKYSDGVWGVNAWGKDSIQTSSLTNAEIIKKYIVWQSTPTGIYEAFSSDGITYTDEPKEENAYSDPKGKFWCSYELDADIVDWILENVFGKTPDRSLSDEDFYYSENKVYVDAELGGGPGYIYKITNHEKLSDGSYDIYVEEILDNGSMETTYLNFTATPKQDSEKGIYWQIHSFKRCEKSEATNEYTVHTEQHENTEIQDNLNEQHTDAAGYSDVINQYKTAIQNDFYADTLNGLADDWDVIGDYVSSLFLSHARSYDDNKVHYALVDINNDGTEEMVIGASGDGGDVREYDIFTHDGSKPIPLFYVGSFGERSNFKLYDNGVIYVDGSGGASLHSYQYYQLPSQATELELLDGFCCENYVYYKTDVEGNHLKTISEAEFENIQSKYDTQELELNWVEITV